MIMRKQTFERQEEQTPEAIMAAWSAVADPSAQKVLHSGAAQSEKFLAKANALTVSS